MHPLRGATPAAEEGRNITHNISIHAPLAGRDRVLHHVLGALIKFQSTRPLRGATVDIKPYNDNYYISIHAPLAGRDALN